MSVMDEYADALSQEILVEMAESFFGARKSLDDEKELFRKKVEQVKHIAWTALARTGLLHALLLDNKAAPEFYKGLKVVPKRLFALVDPLKARLFLPMPWALGPKGRYEKLLIRTYEAVQDSFDEYLHGRYYEDPRFRGRKRLSLHYYLLKDWAEHINGRVNKVNVNQAPSCVLSFAKDMHVADREKERITEATLDGYSNTLNNDLAIAPVNIQKMGLPQLPDLPPLPEVKSFIADFARDLYESKRDEVLAVMERVSQCPVRYPDEVAEQ